MTIVHFTPRPSPSRCWQCLQLRAAFPAKNVATRLEMAFQIGLISEKLRGLRSFTSKRGPQSDFPQSAPPSS